MTTSPAAPANTSSPAAQPPAATNKSAGAAEGQPASLLEDVCVVEGKEANAILIERPISETKVVEIQPGQEYLFGFSKSEPVSFVQEGNDLTIAFDCGGILVLKGYVTAMRGSKVAQFAFSDVVPQGVLEGLIKIVETKDEKALEDELLANKAHNKQADGADVAKIEPAAGDTDAQKLANIEPAAGEQAGAGGNQNTGFGFGSSFSSEAVGPLQAVGPIDPTALQYNAEFPTPRPFIETPVDSNPSIGAAANDVDETNMVGGTVSVSGNIPVNFGADGPGTIEGNGIFAPGGSLAAGQLTSHGQQVNVSYDTVTGTYTGSTASGPVFTMAIDPVTGNYVFTLLAPIDHADGTNPNDVIGLVFGVVATDSDGDAAFTSVTINVFDDAPYAVLPAVETIDEGALSGGPIVVTDNLAIDFGQDGAGAVHVNGTSSVSGDVLPGGLSSGGNAITITFDAATNTYTGATATDTIFKMEINDATGAYKFTLFKPLDHAAPGDTISLNFGVTVEDYDHDTTTTDITINIIDDVPHISDTPGIGSGIETVDETNLGPITVNGALNVDFGSDGKGAVGFAGGYTSSTPLTSHGQTVTVALNGNVYEGKVGNNVIFKLELQSDGKYAFTQIGALDHPNANNPNDSITLNFGVQISDSDGDTDTGSITINVLDDGPKAYDDSLTGSDDSTILTGNVLGNDNAGKDGLGAVKSVEFSGVTTNIAPGAQVTINGTYGTLKIGSDGAFTYTPKVGTDGTDNFKYTMHDYDGDTSSAKLTISVADDEPILVQPEVVTVDETNLSPTTSISDSIQANFFNDGPGTFAGNGGFTGGPFTSHGVPVTVAFDATTRTYTGTAGGAPVFTLVVQQNGQYTFTLIKPLDHPVDGPTAAEHNDPVSMQFGITATDNDGDSVSGTITVKVLDDGPKAYDDGFNAANDSTPVTGNVLTNDNAGKDGLGAVQSVEFNGVKTNIAPGAEVTINGTYGTLKINSNGAFTYTPKVGSDGTDTFKYTMQDYDGDTSSAKLSICVADDEPILVQPEVVTVDETNLSPTTSISDSIQANFFNDGPGTFAGNGGFTGGPFTSHGQPVTVAFDAGARTYTGTAGGAPVFTLVVQQNGQYTFTLIKPLDHPVDGPTAADHNDPVSMQFGITATDNDGDSVSGTITVKVLDDGPKAYDDGFNAANDSTPVTGNVITNDNAGKDGLGAVQSVEFNGVKTNIAPGAEVTINGTYGTLKINSNGAFTYTPKVGSDGTDTFKYTMQDYDGDTSSAKLSICVADDEPILVQPELVVVDETNMNPTTSISDSIQANFFNDGPGTFAGNGGFTGGPFTSHGQPVTVAFDAGARTYTGTAGGAPVFTLVIQQNGQYTFTLIKPLDHPVDGPTPADHNDAVSMQFGITATDNDGDSVSGTITVKVLDDGPAAHNDFNTVPHSTNTADGNVITGLNGGPGAADTLSKDVDNTVTKISFNGTTVNVPTTGQATIEGEFGTLKISANGSYTYTQHTTAGGGDLKHFAAGPVAFPDMNESQALDATEVQAKGIAAGNLDIAQGDQISVKFVSEGAAYNNTLGAFTVSADGTLHLTNILIPNGNNVAAGPSFNMTAGAGDTEFGLFIIADGFSANGGYGGIDLNTGHLDFIFDYGLATERAAKITDDGSHIKLVYTSAGGVETVLNGPLYYTTERGDADNLNADDSVRVVSAIAPGGDDTVLRIGFEDLPGLGDNDFNDIVIDLSVRNAADVCGTDVFKYTLTDGDGDTSQATLTLQCEPCKVDVELKVNNGVDKICVKEDGQGIVPLNAHFTGGDGDEVMTLKVTGVTAGWTVTSPGWVNNGGGVYTLTLPAGQALYTGNMTFKPPANSDVDLSGLQFTASVHDPDTNSTQTDTDPFTVQVDAVVDTPVLTVPSSVNYLWIIGQNNANPLPITTFVTDNDGSETVTQVKLYLNQQFSDGVGGYQTLDDVGVYLNKGTETAPGVWTINVNAANASTALSGLQILTPTGTDYYWPLHNAPHSGTIRVESYVSESKLSGGECDYTDNNTVVVQNICFTFAVSPLVVDLNGNGIELVGKDAGITFDMTNDGAADHTSWVGANDGLLSIDLNGDGVINNQSELFGNNDVATNGFANLAQYDVNGDGLINVSDAVFEQLTVWQDANQDGVSQAGELHSLSSLGITSIGVNATETGAVQNADAIITHESVVTYADGHTGQIVDAWFNTTDSLDEGLVRTLDGTQGNDIVLGSNGSDVISGLSGTDTLFGGAGSDIFLFQGLDGSVDTIADFNASEGDSIDISALLNNFDAVQDSINDFVFQTEVDGNTVISVDANGGGNIANATAVAVLHGVTGLSIEDITHAQQQQAA